MSNLIPIHKPDEAIETNDKIKNKLWQGSYSDILTQYPHFDISETDKEIIVKAEIPNISVEDVKISHNNGLLTISGEQKRHYEDKNDFSYRRESFHGSFSRSVNLGNNLDWGNVRADFNNGVFNITVPKN